MLHDSSLDSPLMDRDTVYKDALLDHFRHPRNREDPRGAQFVSRGSNPRCGDDLEVGVDFDGNRLSRVRFRGRGCSVCIASASMMTEAVAGKTRSEASHLYQQMYTSFKGRVGDCPTAPPEPLRPLSAVQQYPARHRCVLLSWEALADALGKS